MAKIKRFGNTLAQPGFGKQPLSYFVGRRINWHNFYEGNWAVSLKTTHVQIFSPDNSTPRNLFGKHTLAWVWCRAYKDMYVTTLFVIAEDWGKN